MLSVSPQCKNEKFKSGRISAYWSEVNVTDLRSQTGDGELMACVKTVLRYSCIPHFQRRKKQTPHFQMWVNAHFKATDPGACSAVHQALDPFLIMLNYSADHFSDCPHLF